MPGGRRPFGTTDGSSTAARSASRSPAVNAAWIRRTTPNHTTSKVHMHPESPGQDLRIGLRVLRKERSFSILAIVVLALGICGVTTMFSVVNGVMLRGFSFPNADRLASANFVDPTSANFFGVNGQISTMDFEEIRR